MISGAGGKDRNCELRVRMREGSLDRDGTQIISSVNISMPHIFNDPSTT